MGNCLVTQLKAIADNDNQPLFGKVQFKVGPYPAGTSQEDIAFELYYGRRIDIKSITPGIKVGEVLDYNKTKIQDLTTNSNGDATYTYPSDATNMVYVVLDRYKIKQVLNNSHGKLLELVDYNINTVLSTPSLVGFCLHGSNCTGSLPELLSKLSKPTDLETCMLSYCSVSGGITDIISCKKLSGIRFSNCSIIGNIEDLVEGQIQGGRDYANYPTIMIVETNTLKLNNVYFTGGTITFGANNTAVVTNSGGATVASYDGSTWTYA